jgi:hypothetical protein
MPKTAMKSLLPSFFHISAAPEPNTSLTWQLVEKRRSAVHGQQLPTCVQATSLPRAQSAYKRLKYWFTLSLRLI